MSVAICVEALTKKYKDVIAVNNISFSVEQGHCFGLLGPNGAGKTTTIEIMEGIIAASSGSVIYKNKENQAKEVDNNISQQIGIQFQHTALQDFLTVKETLNLFAAFYQHTLAQEKIIFFAPKLALAFIILFRGLKVIKKLERPFDIMLSKLGLSESLRPFLISMINFMIYI